VTCTGRPCGRRRQRPDAAPHRGPAPGGLPAQPPRIAVQFLYAFVTDDDGVKVLDLSDPDQPPAAPGGDRALRDAQGLYAARTYLYVADGADGLAIIDIKNPEAPRTCGRSSTPDGR
jgi:hypothetical protein